MNHDQPELVQSKVTDSSEKNDLFQKVTPPLFIRAKPAGVYRTEASIPSLECEFLVIRTAEVQP